MTLNRSSFIGQLITAVVEISAVSSGRYQKQEINLSYIYNK